MISKLVRFSIDNRWLVILLTVMTAAGGALAFRSLPIDAVPDITNVQVQVNTAMEAMGPEEIERTITLPIESALNGIAGVTQVRSITRYGLSQVTTVFEDDTDIYRARQLISERLQALGAQLPKGAQPQLGPVSTGLGEILVYAIDLENPSAAGEARTRELMELRAIQDWQIKPRLLTVKGVAEVNTIGGYEKQYQVQPDPVKMARVGVHFDDLKEAIGNVNLNAGGGYIEQTGDQFIVQGNGLFRDPRDIGAVPVKTLENQTVISIADVAAVKVGHELRTGAALLAGREVVLGTVMMLLGENSRTVSERAAEQLELIKSSLPGGYKVETVYNRSDLVKSTLNTVEHNLVLGAILVITVLLLLVGNARAALITAITIPLSLLFTFIAMKRFGISANLVSLGALDFGIIVDGAVIVLDNCVRHVHDKTSSLKRSLTAMELKDAVHRATVEIRKSAGFGELIIIVVFLPIFAFVGIEGKMFVPMAATFISALIAALVLSFTFVPALASLLLKGRVEDREPWLMRQAYRLYAPLLNWGLTARAALISVAIATTLLGGFLFSRLGGEFLPSLDEGAITLNVIKPVSVGLTYSVGLEEKTQAVISRFPEVKRVFAKIGTSEVATDPMGPNVGDTHIMLKPKADWPLVEGRQRTKQELVSAIIRELNAEVPGQRYLASQPIELRFNELLEGTRSNVSIKVFGDDHKQLAQAAQSISQVIAKVPGAADVEVENKGTISVLEVTPKTDLLRRLGVSSKEVMEAVGMALGGEEVGVFYEGTRRIPITIRMSDESRSDIQAVKSLPVGISGNTTAPLQEVAEIRFKEANSTYSREQTKRRIAVLVNPRGVDTERFVHEAQARVAQEVKLPPGTYLEWGGNFKNLKEAKLRLSLLAPMALILILLMIYAAFRNTLQTALIFLCVPFALVGGVLGLMIKDLPFSISAGVGFIALSGIAVLNGVVLVSYFNQLRSRGMTGKALVEKGANLRLRPVLMTALVDVFGFLPMALSHGAGAEVQQPLATVVIGGILSSTALTLLVLPTLYLALEKRLVSHNPSPGNIPGL